MTPSAPANTVRDLRMLCLHGYHGTGAILRRQMAPLAAAIPLAGRDAAPA
jgi:hypothetical protein